MLDNLLENAVKYSSGDARIELRVEADADHVRFAVQDHGLGIPGDELRRIFAKFYRCDPYLTGGVGGTGLGLYICRELVRRMGGRISASSQLGHGSTFTVDLAAAGGSSDWRGSGRTRADQRGRASGCGRVRTKQLPARPPGGDRDAEREGDEVLGVERCQVRPEGEADQRAADAPEHDQDVCAA